MASSLPVLIIGAGIAGLVLAQSLRKVRPPSLHDVAQCKLMTTKHGIPFIVFERDQTANSRLQGWALTIHFALDCLLQLLPDDILAQLDDTQVDPQLSHDGSNSVFINLETCEYKWKLPPSHGTRKRLARDRFRRLLLTGLEPNIHWCKDFEGFLVEDGLPTARFKDGSSYSGRLLVGADGSSSRLRSQLYDLSAAPPRPLPITFVGTSLLLRGRQLQKLRAIDPTLFQGCHPKTSTWMWFSVMESPSVNGTASLPADDRIWRVQLCLSWPWAGPADSDDLSTDEARVQAMRQKAAEFDGQIKDVFYSGLTSSHRPVLKLELFDWSMPETQRRESDGAVTLMGDAAHTMSMCASSPSSPSLAELADVVADKGEGFNHSIIDAHHLTKAIKKMYDTRDACSEAGLTRKAAIESYEAEVRERGKTAVVSCREACLEAHDWDALTEDSTVRKRNNYIGQ